jgi:hypothetical protein
LSPDPDGAEVFFEVLSFIHFLVDQNYLQAGRHPYILMLSWKAGSLPARE